MAGKRGQTVRRYAQAIQPPSSSADPSQASWQRNRCGTGTIKRGLFARRTALRVISSIQIKIQELSARSSRVGETQKLAAASRSSASSQSMPLFSEESQPRKCGMVHKKEEKMTYSSQRVCHTRWRAYVGQRGGDQSRTSNPSAVGPVLRQLWIRGTSTPP